MTLSDVSVQVCLEAGGEGAEVAGELDLLVYRLHVEAELAGLGGAVAAVRAGVAAPVLALGVPAQHLRRAARVVAHLAVELDPQVLRVHVRRHRGLGLACELAVFTIMGLRLCESCQYRTRAMLHSLVIG